MSDKIFGVPVLPLKKGYNDGTRIHVIGDCKEFWLETNGRILEITNVSPEMRPSIHYKMPKSWNNGCQRNIYKYATKKFDEFLDDMSAADQLMISEFILAVTGATNHSLICTGCNHIYQYHPDEFTIDSDYGNHMLKCRKCNSGMPRRCKSCGTILYVPNSVTQELNEISIFVRADFNTFYCKRCIEIMYDTDFVNVFKVTVDKPVYDNLSKKYAFMAIKWNETLEKFQNAEVVCLLCNKYHISNMKGEAFKSFPSTLKYDRFGCNYECPFAKYSKLINDIGCKSYLQTLLYNQYGIDIMNKIIMSNLHANAWTKKNHFFMANMFRVINNNFKLYIKSL